MIIGVDATSRWIQYAALSQGGVQSHEWDGVGTIETLPMRIQSLCSDTEPLTGALIILGPGSYTGIRLSLTTLKVLTMVHEVPLMGVSLFDAYLTLNHHLLQGVTVLTSPSRKGVFNAQLFQATDDGFDAMSSLLQLTQNELKVWLGRFEAPIHWHHFGDDLLSLDASVITGHGVRLDLVGLIRHHQHHIPSLSKGSSLSPIYSYPPVVQ
ncbi:hypothetical protein DID73_00155 [Candidatus Marinamargulisbacteria bacterium SCGC AG-343-K17]|nr:hypothetical protein DID73_00155 [Candidatus Marinamargulisbacteria bacterium SCGC AG-343-K17]